MRTIQAKELTTETFAPFGSFARMLNPQAEKFGKGPIEFYRDMLQANLRGNGLPSFSICRVEKRALAIDVAEYHSATCEGILPLDNDVLIHVAPATGKAEAPLDRFQVFHVPKGTMVILRPGVWHQAPFTTNDDPANVVIVLPERTYANDCVVVNLDEQDRIKIG